MRAMLTARNAVYALQQQVLMALACKVHRMQLCQRGQERACW